MKRVLSILVAVMMLVCAMALSASAAQTYNAVYGIPTIDGVVSAGEWDDAEAVEMAVKTNPGKELPANPTMQVLHDDTTLYILVTGPAPSADANVFVCVHLPHANCELDGCGTYLKLVIDGDSIAKGNTDCWTYAKDENMDGVNDFAEGTNGGKTTLGTAAYRFVDGIFTAELAVKANYGKNLPTGAASFDVRLDNDTCWATHQWANQMRTWDATFNPAWDGGTLYILAEGEDAPITEEPVVTEPATEEVTEPATEEVTEPATEEATEPATEEATEPATEKNTEKADEPAVTTGADDASTEEGSFPVVPVVIAAVVVIVIIVGVVLAKKKKN